MAHIFRINIPEDSAEGQAIASLAKQQHVTPQEAAKRLIKLATESPSDKATPTKSTPEFTEPRVPVLSVAKALKRVYDLGKIGPSDDPELMDEKLDAIRALSDAEIENGMETWNTDRILSEIAERRGEARSS